MAEDIKVPEVPTPVETKVETSEPVEVNKREAIESAVEEANALIPEVESEEVAEVKTPETLKTETKEDADLDPIQRIKKATQKRFDKLTAQKKSAEEELIELRAENERLKANPKQPEKEVVPENDAPPTLEQVEDYIAQMQSEGNFKEAAKATRYLVKLEKDQAFKEIEDKQKTVQTQTQAQEARANQEMKALANDYVVYDDTGKPDITSDMTLANQNGLLFKLAKDYFDDKDRHAERYNDQNIVNGFRRAVADAYRDIAEHNRTTRLTPKGEETVIRRTNTRAALADPGADFSDENPSQSSNTSSLSDADKVREEIKSRRTRR